MRRIVSVRLRRHAMPARDTLQSRGEWRVGFFLNGQVVSGVGVTGGHYTQDMEVAQAALGVLEASAA